MCGWWRVWDGVDVPVFVEIPGFIGAKGRVWTLVQGDGIAVF
jgi:hypothetical protein